MTSKTKQTEQWEIRNAGEEDVDPHSINLNPNNPYDHTEEIQQAMWNEEMQKRSFIGRVIVNKNTLNVVDGHFRVEMARKKKQKTIPVQWVDLTQEEENEHLATFRAMGESAKLNIERFKFLKETIPEMGNATDAFTEALLDTKPYVEQINEMALFKNSKFSEIDDLAQEDNSDDDFFNELMSNDSKPLPKSKKNGKPVFLDGDNLAMFIRILRNLGIESDYKGAKSVVVILGDG